MKICFSISVICYTEMKNLKRLYYNSHICIGLYMFSVKCYVRICILNKFNCTDIHAFNMKCLLVCSQSFTIVLSLHRFAEEVQDIKQLPSDHRLLLNAMTTCHSLTIINGILSGDPLDLIMFNATEWVCCLCVCVGGGAYVLYLPIQDGGP